MDPNHQSLALEISILMKVQVEEDSEKSITDCVILWSIPGSNLARQSVRDGMGFLLVL